MSSIPESIVSHRVDYDRAGANVVSVFPDKSARSPFDHLTASLVTAQHRSGTLPESPLVALLTAAGLRQ